MEHIQHIYEDGELEESATCRKFRQVRQEGSRMVERELPYYNLDMIISLGYRVRSRVATHFRKWATERLKEYIIKGFAMDDERLKQLGGGNYWKELLDRIRDIRSSEKIMYRQETFIFTVVCHFYPIRNVYDVSLDDAQCVTQQLVAVLISPFSTVSLCIFDDNRLFIKCYL